MTEEKKGPVLQGTVQEFEDAVIGIQMSMAIKMASSHGLRVHALDIYFNWVDGPVGVNTILDKTGKGLLIFMYRGRKITYQLGGIYAFLIPGSEPLKNVDPCDLLLVLNRALKEHRALQDA